MNAFAADPFGAEGPAQLQLDLYTASYRVTGSFSTRFSRVAELLNQLTAQHMILHQAIVSEYDDPAATLGAHQIYVALNEVLLCVAASEAEPRPEMRIPKRPVKAQIAIPPFRLTGTVHVPQGSRPSDGLLNATERFLPVTDVTIACARYPELGRAANVVAVHRSLAHMFLVADDERPDELLAEVLDERTAQGWLAGRAPIRDERDLNPSG
jgi:hypothetical protein